MIYQVYQTKQIIVEFEGGDIATGKCIAPNGECGSIAFYEIEKTKIGTKVNTGNRLPPVRLIFKNPATIDVIIESLKDVKKDMLEKRKED